jgi:hypothetical protein
MNFLLSFLLLLTLALAVTGKHKRHAKTDRAIKGKRKKCEAECSDFLPLESDNCVNVCLSPKCYKQIYESEPLEDGEVDTVRARIFTSCVRKAMRRK